MSSPQFIFFLFASRSLPAALRDPGAAKSRGYLQRLAHPRLLRWAPMTALIRTTSQKAALLTLLANGGAHESQGGFVVGWQWMSCLAARHPSTPRAVRAIESQQEDRASDTPRLLSGGYRRDQ